MGIADSIMLQLAKEGDRLFNAEKYAEAEQKYRETMRRINLRPSDRAIVLAKIGHSLLFQGRLDTAEQALTEAVAADPNSAYALTYLAGLWANQGKFREAMEACTKAGNLLEQGAAIYDTPGLRSEKDRLLLWLLSRRRSETELFDELTSWWSNCCRKFLAQFHQAEQLTQTLAQRSAAAAAAAKERNGLVATAENLLADVRRAREKHYGAQVKIVASGVAETPAEAKALQAQGASIAELVRKLDAAALKACALEDKIAAAFSESWAQMEGIIQNTGALREAQTTLPKLIAECQRIIGRIEGGQAQPDLLRRANELRNELDFHSRGIAEVCRILGKDWIDRFFPERITPANEDRFSDDQVVAIVQDEKPADDLCQEHGIAAETLARWKTTYAGKTIEQVGQIRESMKPSPARLFKRKVDLELYVLKRMRNTGLVFAKNLNDRLAVIKSDIRVHTALVERGGSYALQLSELKSHRDAILETRKQACGVLEALRPLATAKLDEAAIRKIWDEQIVLVAIREQARLIRAKRPMGPVCDTQEVTGKNCQGRQNKALVDIATMLDSEARRDPRYAELWRWATRDEKGSVTIRLYYHHPSEKWKCQHFRIGVARARETVVFTLQSHVNFGLGNDPTQYKMDQSRVYNRPMPGWSVTNENSMTFSTSNTVNVQRTFTENEGYSLGEIITDQTGSGIAETVSLSTGTSHGGSQSESWSNSSSFSVPADSYGRSFSFGGGDSRNWGGTSSETKATSKSKNYNRSAGVQAGINGSTAEAVTAGLSCTDGTSIQTTSVAFGPDFGVPEKELLTKWQNYNPDAAAVFRSVQQLFEAVCNEEVEHLQSMSKGPDAEPEPDLDACVGKIAALMEVVYTKGNEDLRVAAVPPVALIAGKPGPGGGAWPR